MLRLYTYLRSLVENEEGATAVEYGLLIAVIALIVGGVAATLGTSIATAFTSVTALF